MRQYKKDEIPAYLLEACQEKGEIIEEVEECEGLDSEVNKDVEEIKENEIQPSEVEEIDPEPKVEEVVVETSEEVIVDTNIEVIDSGEEVADVDDSSEVELIENTVEEPTEKQDLTIMRKVDLQSLALENKLDDSGTKKELLTRLEAHLN